MSRIGSKAVEIPAKVKVNIGADGAVAVEGPKGKLSWNLPHSIKGSVQDNRVSIVREAETRSVKALHGLSRSLVHNMVLGVSEGFTKQLEIEGVGFKAAVPTKPAPHSYADQETRQRHRGASAPRRAFFGQACLCAGHRRRCRTRVHVLLSRIRGCSMTRRMPVRAARGERASGAAGAHVRCRRPRPFGHHFEPRGPHVPGGFEKPFHHPAEVRDPSGRFPKEARTLPRSAGPAACTRQSRGSYR